MTTIEATETKMTKTLDKKALLSKEVKHIDMKQTNVVPLVEAMAETAFHSIVALC